MELTSEEIETLHRRHGVLSGEIRTAARRLEEINEAIRSKQLPEGTAFDDIGRPLKERP